MNRPPRRHPQSSPGDFYVADGECLACGLPHVIAESLIGWAETGSHCIWKRQPQTPEEHEQALLILESQEAGCHRYAGTDPAVLRRLPAELCDSQD